MTSSFVGTLQRKRPPEEKPRKRQLHIGELWKKQRPARKPRKRQRDWRVKLSRGARIYHAHLHCVGNVTWILDLQKICRRSHGKGEIGGRSKTGCSKVGVTCYDTWGAFVLCDGSFHNRKAAEEAAEKARADQAAKEEAQRYQHRCSLSLTVDMMVSYGLKLKLSCIVGAGELPWRKQQQ
jgi:hypothetical protein